jgi:hypothetical protein
MSALEDIPPEPPHPERVRMRFLQVGEDHMSRRLDGGSLGAEVPALPVPERESA